MINYRMRLNQILSCPSIITRCNELASFLEVCSVEDLKTYYQLIVDSIFGFPCYVGWGIRRITRNAQPKETEAILRFLAPDGPLFKAIYRLMNDRNFRLEYPISSLPTVLDQRINRLDIPEFFVKKIHITYDSYGQATVLRNIFLNPLEYYFFLFTYVNLSVGANQNYLMGWGTLMDTLYTNLLDDYLNYFFPCDGRGVPPIATQGRPQSETTFNTDPIIQRINNVSSPARTPAEQPTLFRASIFQECMTVTATTRDTGFSPSNTYSYLDIWRSETILNIFIEMWISVDYDTVSSYFRSSLPSVELVKGVRIIVRHLHYFVNCLNQQALHPMEELKRTALLQYQKKLYLFLRHLFNRWPLDNSFRIVYETWLSYIQPWRYNKLENIRHSREKETFGTKEPNVDIALWSGFLTDNILFYTAIFQQMLPRFLRADITSQKNALMLYRATKVFATQQSMKTFLMDIESMVVRFLANPEYHPVGSHSFYHSSGHMIPGDSGVSSSAEYCSPARLAHVKQLILELEPSNSTYKPLFSDETKKMVKNAVTAINQAIEQLETSSETAAPAKQKTSSFLKSIWGDGEHSWIGGKGDHDGTDKTKVSQLLNHAKQQLAFLFNLHNADIQSHDFSVADENNSPEGIHLTPGEFSPSILAKLTPRGTLTEDMLKPRGNPDLASLRSHEVACLVPFLYSISSRLNQKYGQQIINHYYSRDKWGKYARACFARPVLYPVFEKVIPGRQMKAVRYLPPRVNLRPLASYMSVFCAIFVIFVALIFSYSPWLIIFLAAFLYGCFIGLVGCVERPEVLDDLIRNFGPYIHNSEESEYYNN